MMLSDVWRLSRSSGRRAACAAGRLHGAYWLIGPGSADLAQGCRCAVPLQAWAEAYRGGRPPAYSLLYCDVVWHFSLLTHFDCNMHYAIKVTVLITNYQKYKGDKKSSNYWKC